MESIWIRNVSCIFSLEDFNISWRIKILKNRPIFIITYLMTELNIDQISPPKNLESWWKLMLGIYRIRKCIFHFINFFLHFYILYRLYKLVEKVIVKLKHTQMKRADIGYFDCCLVHIHCIIKNNILLEL